MRNWAAGLAFPLTIFVALALLTTWLRYLSDLPSQGSDARFRHHPDYVIKDFRASQLSATGEAEVTLAATRLLHYPDTDETVVEMPRLVYGRPNADPVMVHADRGSLNHGADILHLTDNVELTKPAGALPPMYFKAAEMTVIPQAGLATSSGPVSAHDPTSFIEGTGFTGDFEAREYTLHAEVRGRFTLAESP